VRTEEVKEQAIVFPTKILLATDSSEEAALAARMAAVIAEKTGSEQHVGFVRPRIAPDYAGYYVAPGMVEDAQQKEQKKLHIEAQRLLDAQVEEVRSLPEARWQRLTSG
jgi:nucleotide-binding universal stress UspA family protein